MYLEQRYVHHNTQFIWIQKKTAHKVQATGHITAMQLKQTINSSEKKLQDMNWKQTIQKATETLLGITSTSF